MFCEVHAASIADSSVSGKALATKFREEPKHTAVSFGPSSIIFVFSVPFVSDTSRLDQMNCRKLGGCHKKHHGFCYRHGDPKRKEFSSCL